MGLPVLAEHDSTGYTLSVNHPEVEGVLSFRCQAVAQAVMNFLLEFSPYAFVPEPLALCEGLLGPKVPEEGFYLSPDGENWHRLELSARIADEPSFPVAPDLPPAVEALMDAASPPDPSEVLNNGKAHEGVGE